MVKYLKGGKIRFIYTDAGLQLKRQEMGCVTSGGDAALRCIRSFENMTCGVSYMKNKRQSFKKAARYFFPPYDKEANSNGRGKESKGGKKEPFESLQRFVSFGKAVKVICWECGVG